MFTYNTYVALSFYVHIPYCIKRCGYCDFNTYTPSGYVKNNIYNI